MDELEILKKDWKKREHSFNQLTEKDIYKMLHKRSSSIVKWILIISILEIVLWLTLSFFTTDEHYFKTLEIYHLNKIIPVITIINYGIIIFFIFQFYKNFKNINTTETVKKLMQSIIKTRKTVKYYVWYNLMMSFILFILVFTFQFKYDPNLNEVIEKATQNVNPNVFYTLLFAAYTVCVLIIIGVIWLFYKLLYGILLKRLNRNYKELEKLDL
ncbi:hypothetical protein GOQ30_05085 [Flavobacterium sp. TP390]|uniref:Beta-carotene 15,15'-monooxygenase n=1 Tax=Flavobacterium profundi TaxID=1774945 RepID=A0A6I4IFY6_9FLAO|nr:hypothetical protein [Flavobacterium profundi]MVO08538.1 hypothetical protein [Flavobacterium profundi]